MSPDLDVCHIVILGLLARVVDSVRAIEREKACRDERRTVMLEASDGMTLSTDTYSRG